MKTIVGNQVCPLCRSQFHIPNDEGELSCFPPLYFTQNLVGFHQESQFKDPNKCDLCDENIPAKYCEQCKQEMCEGCTKIHLRTKVALGHILIPIEGITKRDSRPRFCLRHPSQEIISFCSTDETPICGECAVTLHSKHEFLPLDSQIEIFKDEINTRLKLVFFNLGEKSFKNSKQTNQKKNPR